MRISTRDIDPNEPVEFTLRDARGCLRLALGVLAGIVGFLLLTSVPSTVNAWVHRRGYQPTDAVFSSLTRNMAKITIASTGQELTKRKSGLDFAFAEGPRTVLYNPAARATVAGLTLSDDRILVRMDNDFQSEALATTSGSIAFLSAAWLLLRVRKRQQERPRRT